MANWLNYVKVPEMYFIASIKAQSSSGGWLQCFPCRSSSDP